jgi:purine-nucleoside phosphorylase
MLDNGVRNIIACGYVGGIAPEASIGSYGLVTSAAGLDGTSGSYGMGGRDIRASEGIVNALREIVKARGVACHSAPIASIDALLLEDDRMIGELRSQGYGFIDLETACLFALAQERNAAAAALHIVTDNPTRKAIDAASSHEASFNEQVRLALSVLIEL